MPIVCFIGAVYGPICLVQLALVVAYSLVSYRAAGAKAKRNKDAQMARRPPAR